jgi:hypothetical protein
VLDSVLGEFNGLPKSTKDISELSDVEVKLCEAISIITIV